MAVSEQFLGYILDQLQGLGRLTTRRMFSGVGLYSHDLFFGLLFKDRLYFKTDDTTRPEYEARGSEGFRPRANTKRLKMTYYTVPAEILEDGDDLVKWARRAVDIAKRTDGAKRSSGTKRPGVAKPKS